MSLLQKRIGEWHRRTFGEDCSPERIEKKFREESGEFLDDPTEEEASDCLICLFAWADRKGFDLVSSACDKFLEVEARTDQIERDRARGIA